MRRSVAVVLLPLLLLTTMASKLDRLEVDERARFESLSVYMSDDQEKAYLKLKTRELRDAWLKEQKLWDRWYKFEEDMRDAILAGDVRVGWPQEAVYLAWGLPVEQLRLLRNGADRSEKLVYLIEVTSDGQVLVWREGSKVTQDVVERYRYELILDDGFVAEKNRKPGWE